MLYTEWNMEDACRVAAEEAREQAREQALKEGIIRGKLEGEANGIRKSIRTLKDVLSPEILAEKFQLPLDDVLRILEEDATVAQ